MYLDGLVMRYKFFLASSVVFPRKSSRGFGLIELMVSISIMTLVSTVILVKNRSFNNALLLRNQAYEVAFSLRQAQLMAVSGTKLSGTGRNIYGIHFNVASAPDNGRYQMFQDNQGTQYWYDDGADAPIGSIIGTIDNHYVMDITDSSGNGAGSPDTLSITFERPNFDARFQRSSAVNDFITGPVYIKVMPKDSTGYSSSGAVPYRLIEITRTGQITVL